MLDTTSVTLNRERPGSSALWRAARRLRRVASMGFAEAGYRGWQESSKWIERQRLGRDPSDPIAVLRREAPSMAWAATGEFPGEAFRSRFFAGVTAETVTELRVSMPGVCASIQREADALLSGRFDLLGYQDLTFGSPVDWQFDPVSSRRAPLVHWSRIDPLDDTVVGDSKVPWELSRQQWVVRLAQAYLLTGDRRYSDAAAHAIDHWIAANPIGRGINWASSLEVALRLISWTWTISLLDLGGVLASRLMTTLLASIQAHAAHVAKYLSYYFSPNTHLTGEALGLFYAGVLFPQFRDAASWRDTGARILIHQLPIQVTDDGVYFEQSTCYQKYTCEFYLHFLLLAGRSGYSLPGLVRDRLLRMLDFLVAVRRPDGSIPSIGDADSGNLLPLVRRTADDFSGLFGVAAALFQRADYAWAAGRLTPEVLWLLGRDGSERFRELRRRPPQGPSLQVFARGGYAIQRSGFDRDAHQLIVDVGPLGCPVSSGHGHADLLSIQCSAFGDPVLVDAGTYCYTGEAQWRTHFRSTAAHSTVTVDGQGQASPSDPFHWDRRPRAVLRAAQSTPEFDLVDANHQAYAAQDAAVVHRRRVIFVKPDFWIVVDDVEGTGEHTIDLHFQFAPIRAELIATLNARAETTRGSIFWIVPTATVPLSADLQSGSVAPMRGWVSESYGRKRPAPSLVYSARSALPLRAITLLYPTRNHSEAAPVVSGIRDGSRLIGIDVTSANVAVRLDRDRVVIDRR